MWGICMEVENFTADGAGKVRDRVDGRGTNAGSEESGKRGGWGGEGMLMEKVVGVQQRHGVEQETETVSSNGRSQQGEKNKDVGERQKAYLHHKNHPTYKVLYPLYSKWFTTAFKYQLATGLEST